MAGYLQLLNLRQKHTLTLVDQGFFARYNYDNAKSKALYKLTLEGIGEIDGIRSVKSLACPFELISIVKNGGFTYSEFKHISICVLEASLSKGFKGRLLYVVCDVNGKEHRFMDVFKSGDKAVESALESALSPYNFLPLIIEDPTYRFNYVEFVFSGIDSGIKDTSA